MPLTTGFEDHQVPELSGRRSTLVVERLGNHRIRDHMAFGRGQKHQSIASLML